MLLTGFLVKKMKKVSKKSKSGYIHLARNETMNHGGAKRREDVFCFIGQIIVNQFWSADHLER